MSDADAVAVAEADPVPNRHAALHGLVSYAAPNASLNALAGAEYLLAAISTIRLLAERDAAGEDRAG